MSTASRGANPEQGFSRYRKSAGVFDRQWTLFSCKWLVCLRSVSMYAYMLITYTDNKGASNSWEELLTEDKQQELKPSCAMLLSSVYKFPFPHYPAYLHLCILLRYSQKCHLRCLCSQQGSICCGERRGLFKMWAVVMKHRNKLMQKKCS